MFLKNYYPMNELLEVDDDEFLEIKNYYSSFSKYSIFKVYFKRENDYQHKWRADNPF